MSKSHSVTAHYVDTCYPDFIRDHRGILVGIERAGQTRDELIEALAEAAYEHEDWPDDAIGEHAYSLLKSAISDALNTDPSVWPFWPVDKTGNDITDPDAEVPDEQPSIWFRFEVESAPLKIKLTNHEDDDGQVLVTCEDVGAAADDGYIDGSTWETPRDMNEAYTFLTNRPTIVAELTAEGYDVDASEYSPPDEEDLARWEAKCRAESGE